MIPWEYFRWHLLAGAYSWLGIGYAVKWVWNYLFG